MTGYVADVRVVSGAALYTSTFTVPSAPLSASATGTTQFLLRAGQNAPTVQNGALTFDRGLKQYIEYGPQTFNLATRGFTAVFKWQNTGTAGSYERVFEFGNAVINGSTCSSISVWRDSQNLAFYIFPPGSASGTGAVTSSASYVQNTTYVGVARYDPVTQLMTIWVNGIQVASQSLTTANAADRTLATVRLGGDVGGTNQAIGPNIIRCLNATMNTFAIYNRALSNVEILNAYSALTTSTVNAPIEIGDANGTPALSVASDGRVNITKMGQSSNVVPWPPSGMVSFFTTINNGNYIASSSSYYGANPPWYAFDKTNTQWASAYNTPSDYSTTIPYNANSTAPSTTDVNGNVYLGAWLQIQNPVSITLSYYIFQGSYSVTTWGPARFALLGSRDGVNWFLVDSQSGLSWSTSYQTKTCTPQNTQSYSYFRYVCLQVVGNPGNTEVGELTLYGTADTAQTLTVAQPVTLSYGAQTASLTGIAGDKYVPQDFSSSGLNIPAYVVSNTATTANTVAFSSFGPFAGEGSFQFSGGSLGRIAFPSGTSPNFNLSSTSVCTFEFWVYPFGPKSAFISHTPAVSGLYDWGMFMESDKKLGWYSIGGAGLVYSTSAMNINAWNHCVFSFTGGTVYIGLNGTVNSGSMGAPGFTTTALMTIGNDNYSPAQGYISCVRIVFGQALYTTTFTPPTGPLQPIQGVTQAGTPYGTVLLLRNAPAPGRVLTQKFGGSNSGQVLAFPPAAMTSYATALNSGYGQGTYVASSSGDLSTSFPPWQAFDKNPNVVWISAGAYNSGAPYGPVGSNVTVDVTGTSYTGEWLQIQKPSSIVLASYLITAGGVGNGQSPARFWIFGSRDGTNWSVIDSRSGITTWTAGGQLTFSVTSSQAFTYFRMVVNQLGAYYASTPNCVIAEWTLNGTIEGPAVSADGRLGLGVTAPTQALEVAGSAVVAGTLSAGNPLMFRNRIINGDMRVWQRGTTSFSGLSTIAYCFDRFSTYIAGTGGGTRTINQVTDVPFGGPFFYSANVIYTAQTTGVVETFLRQGIELANFTDLTKTPITVSFWYKSNRIGTHGARLFSNSSAVSNMSDTALGFNVNNANTWEYKVLTFGNSANSSLITSASLNQLAINLDIGPMVAGQTTITINNNDYFTLTGVQLEKGSVATPYEIRPYATELALCQRYYYQITALTNSGGSQSNINWGIAYVRSFGNASIYYSLPVPMRTQPTFFNNATLQFDWNAVANLGTFNSPVLVTNKSNNKDIEIDGTVTGGTQGQAGAIILASPTAGQYVSFNAEL
jgi:hypothetical protein